MSGSEFSQVGQTRHEEHPPPLQFEHDMMFLPFYVIIIEFESHFVAHVKTRAASASLRLSKPSNPLPSQRRFMEMICCAIPW